MNTMTSMMDVHAAIARTPTTCTRMPPPRVAPSVGEWPPHLDRVVDVEAHGH